jgi:hypothetical protein
MATVHSWPRADAVQRVTRKNFGRPPWSANRPFVCESGALTRRVRADAHAMADGGEVRVVPITITGHAFRYTAPEPLRDVALGSLRARHIPVECPVWI